MLVIFLFGCTSTSIYSHKDKDADRYKNFLVFFRTNDFSIQKRFEDNIVKEFKKNNISAVAKYEIFPATSTSNADEFGKIMTQRYWDAILLLDLLQSTQNNLLTPDLSYSQLKKTINFQLVDIAKQKTVLMGTINSSVLTVTELTFFTNYIDSFATDIGKTLVNKLKDENLLPMFLY